MFDWTMDVKNIVVVVSYKKTVVSYLKSKSHLVETTKSPLKVLIYIFSQFHLKAAKRKYKDTFNFVLRESRFLEKTDFWI
jgi:CTP:phosphocholine cytidylyltransferase-like protein